MSKKLEDAQNVSNYVIRKSNALRQKWKYNKFKGGVIYPKISSNNNIQLLPPSRKYIFCKYMIHQGTNEHTYLATTLYNDYKWKMESIVILCILLDFYTNISFYSYFHRISIPCSKTIIYQNHNECCSITVRSHMGI